VAANRVQSTVPHETQVASVSWFGGLSVSQVAWIMLVSGAIAVPLQIRLKLIFDGPGLIERCAKVAPYAVSEILGASDLAPCRYTKRGGRYANWGRRHAALIDFSDPSSIILFTECGRVRLPRNRSSSWEIKPTIGRTIIQFPGRADLPMLDVPHSMLGRLPRDIRFRPYWRVVRDRFRSR